MKKAIAIVGSPRKQKAVSYQICYSLLKEIKKQIDEFEYKIYCPFTSPTYHSVINP